MVVNKVSVPKMIYLYFYAWFECEVLNSNKDKDKTIKVHKTLPVS